MQQVRLWEIMSDRKKLEEIETSAIRLEGWIEDWLENDISVLDTDLMVIGRQVYTSFGGAIDLLCIDRDGNLVVTELKKGRTPRDVTAQTLDYASWIKGLSFDDVADIANNYFEKKDSDVSLESAFMERFETKLPDDLKGHRSLIVAESFDASTERIVRYLAELGVPINVATVQHLRDKSGREFLAQVHLIEPETVQARARSKSSRPAYLGVNALQEMADKNGIGELYRRLRNGIKGIFFARGYDNTVAYVRKLENGGQRTMILVKAVPGRIADAAEFTVHATRFEMHMGIGIDELRGWLPANTEEDPDVKKWSGSTPEERESATGFRGFFQTEKEVDKFLSGLKRRAD